MQKQIDDSLKIDASVLIDGELDELAYRRLLESIDNIELRQKIQNYSIVKSLLNNEYVDTHALKVDIASRVRAEIERHAEPVELDNKHKTKAVAKKPVSQTWYKPAIGFAMAASIAFVMVFNIDNYNLLQSPEIAATNPSTQLELNDQPSQTSNYHAELNKLLSRSAGLSEHVSYAEQELNDPYQVVVAADQELRKREQILLKAQQQNTQLQRQLREYLIRHTRQNVSNPVNNMLPIARASYREYSE